MSTLTIFLVGCFVSILCGAFVVVSTIELRRVGKESDERAQRTR